MRLELGNIVNENVDDLGISTTKKPNVEKEEEETNDDDENQLAMEMIEELLNWSWFLTCWKSKGE